MSRGTKQGMQILFSHIHGDASCCTTMVNSSLAARTFTMLEVQSDTFRTCYHRSQTTRQLKEMVKKKLVLEIKFRDNKAER